MPWRFSTQLLSGMGGRLYYELTEKESLAYALSFFVQSNVDKGFLGIYMGTRADKLETAVKAALRELRKVREEGLTEDEVERAKRYLIGNFEIGLQTNRAQANQSSTDELYGLGFDHFRKYPEMIEKVTTEEVQRVARDYMDLEEPCPGDHSSSPREQGMTWGFGRRFARTYAGVSSRFPILTQMRRSYVVQTSGRIFPVKQRGDALFLPRSGSEVLFRFFRLDEVLRASWRMDRNLMTHGPVLSYPVCD